MACHIPPIKSKETGKCHYTDSVPSIPKFNILNEWDRGWVILLNFWRKYLLLVSIGNGHTVTTV